MYKLHDKYVKSPLYKQTTNIHFSSTAEVYFQRGAAELPAVAVTSVAGTYSTCFRLTSTSSVGERLSVPLLSRERVACDRLFSGLEMLAYGQVSQPVSINTIINSVRDVSGILNALCCHTQSP